MLKFINLKGGLYNVDSALATVEIEIERSKLDGTVAIKVLHGYGSHGRGGVIMVELRRALFHWKKIGFVKNYFGGEKWNLFDKDSQQILMKDKSISGDPDLSNANPGITIIEV